MKFSTWGYVSTMQYKCSCLLRSFQVIWVRPVARPWTQWVQRLPVWMHMRTHVRTCVCVCVCIYIRIQIKSISSTEKRWKNQYKHEVPRISVGINYFQCSCYCFLGLGLFGNYLNSLSKILVCGADDIYVMLSYTYTVCIILCIHNRNKRLCQNHKTNTIITHFAL